MTSKTAWKNREAIIAAFFGTKRNPLSGRNNRSDDGSRRLGDIVYPFPKEAPAVVEVKLRGKVASVVRAQETAALAKEYGREWVHFESTKGDQSIWCVCLPEELVKEVIDKVLRPRWEKEKINDQTKLG